MGLRKKMRTKLTHLIGRITKRYYFEDYLRVYPDEIAFDKYGKKVPATEYHRINFLNHQKCYYFAAQFVKGKNVADIGCGSGHGCKILKEFGANHLSCSDISKPAIEFAQKKYGAFSEFIVQGATCLKEYAENRFDISISFEVLEHLKEYGVEKKLSRK